MTPSTAVEQLAMTTAGMQPPVDDTPLSETAELFACTSFSKEFLDDAAAQVEIDQLIVAQTVGAAAYPTAVTTLCPGIPMNAAFVVSVVGQFDGATVQSDAFEGVSPGVGSGSSNSGDPLPVGSCQVFASDSDEVDVARLGTSNDFENLNFSPNALVDQPMTPEASAALPTSPTRASVLPTALVDSGG
jgi:hypothetical protein